MSRGKLKREDDECIQKNYIYLKTELDDLEIVDYLYQHGVITREEKDMISLKSSKMTRNEALLKAIQNAGPGNAFNIFINALEQNYPHVVEKLRPTVSQATNYREEQSFRSLNRSDEPSESKCRSKRGGVGEKIDMFSALHYSKNQSNNPGKSTKSKGISSYGQKTSSSGIGGTKSQQLLGAHKPLQDYSSDDMKAKTDLIKGVTKGVSKLTSSIKRSFREYKNVYWNKDIDILLLGKTGNGKSATGNSILQNQYAFITFDSFSSVTKDIQYSHSEFEGRRIKVVDGPGFEDTGHLYDLEKAKSELIHKMEDAVLQHPDGYHAVLFVLKYGGRFTAEDKNVINIIKSIFGEDIIKHYCILLMTHGDNFEQNNSQTQITFHDWCLRQDGVFKDLMDECENRIVLFDNCTRNVEKQIAQLTTLIKMVDNLQSKGRRYDSSHFKAAKQNRKQLLVAIKHPRIYSETFKELEIIQNKFKYLCDHSSDDDLEKLDLLLLRAQEIDSVVQAEDEDTGALKDILQMTGALCRLITSMKPTITTRHRESELLKRIEILNKSHEIEMEEIRRQKKKIEKENIKLREMELTNVQENLEKKEREIETNIEKTKRNSEAEQNKLKIQLDDLQRKTAKEREMSTQYLEQIDLLKSSLQRAELNKEKALEILKKELSTVQMQAKKKYDALQKRMNEERKKLNEEYETKMNTLRENYEETLNISLQAQSDLREELQRKDEQHNREFTQLKQMYTVYRQEYAKRFTEQAGSKCSVM